MNVLKTLYRSLREYKKPSFLSMLFVGLEALLETAIPLFMTLLAGLFTAYEVVCVEHLAVYTIDIATIKINFTSFEEIRNYLIITSILLVVLAFGSLTCGILAGNFCSKASAGLAKNLREDLFESVSNFSFSNVDKFSSSSLVTRMTTDVSNVQMSFMMIVRTAIRSPLMLIFSIVMAFLISPRLAWIFLIAIPLIFVALVGIIAFALPRFRSVFRKYDILNNSIQENISGMRTVKSFVREDYEDQKFTNASHSLSKDFIKAEKIVALMTPLMNTSIHVVYLLTMYFASLLIFQTSSAEVVGVDEKGNNIYQYYWGELSPSEMSALLTYGIQILMSIMMISMIVTMLVMSIESIRRIGEVLDEEPTIVDPENPVTIVDDGSVVFNNVSFKYKKEAELYAVSNLNINIKSGDFVGIIGSTGSGKSTLVNLISRLYDTTDGEVIVGGHNVKEYSIEALRDSVAMVLQKNFLFSGTIRSNMKWGNKEATDEEIIKAIEIAQIPDVLKHYQDGLDHVVEQGGANFSGGQKQRLCIARAIVKEPKILILDDSTSAVDTKTDKLIRRALKEDLPKMTKIVIAQRISSIEEADQIIVLDNGKINAIGTHEQLLKSNDIYKEVYISQTQKGGN